MPLETLTERRRSNRWIRRGLITWIVVFTVAVFVLGRQNRTLAQEGAAARDALCELRYVRDRDLDRARQYLADHPNGVRGLITVEELQRIIAERLKTVRALSELDCPTRGNDDE